MRTSVYACAVALSLLLSTAVAGSQTAAPQTTAAPPNFSVQVWGDVIAEFGVRVQQYFELRRKLESELPPLVLTDNSHDIITAELALAERVRRARRPAKQGAIFTPAIAKAFREVLAPVLTGLTLDVVMDENPGRFEHSLDSRYPTAKPKATIPTTLLQLLPPLPDDLQYGFIGRQLIIHDTRTGTIVDRMTCAIPCGIRLPEKKDD